MTSTTTTTPASDSARSDDDDDDGDETARIHDAASHRQHRETAYEAAEDVLGNLRPPEWNATAERLAEAIRRLALATDRRFGDAPMTDFWEADSTASSPEERAAALHAAAPKAAATIVDHEARIRHLEDRLHAATRAAESAQDHLQDQISSQREALGTAMEGLQLARREAETAVPAEAEQRVFRLLRERLNRIERRLGLGSPTGMGPTKEQEEAKETGNAS